MVITTTLSSLLLLAPSRADACTTVLPPDLVSPSWGSVPTGAVIATQPGADAPTVVGQSGEIVLDGDDLDGLYRLPGDVEPGLIVIDGQEVLVVEPDEWEPGPPPQLDVVELDFGWVVDHPACKTVGGSWELRHYLEVTTTPTDGAGWFIQGVAGDEVVGRLATSTPGLDARYTAWSYEDPQGSDRERCLDIELVDAAGQVHDTVALSCQDAPRKPLLPACSAAAGAPAALSTLLALAGLLGLARRRA